MRIITTLLLLFIFTPTISAKSMYVDDTLFVPLRSGQGLGYRIVHKGIKSGTSVEVMEQSSETGYSKIKEPGGAVGWLPTRFLVSEPIAKDKLEAALKKLQILESKDKNQSSEISKILEENSELKESNTTLGKLNSTLTTELEEIKSISSNAIFLDQRNRELQESNQQLRNELELLQADNQRLKDKSETDFMLLGGGLVGLGVLIALIIPWMKPTKKNDSWA
ncbi:SH3 domain protein [Oleiphilus messinensis]|uniref:SH3 domain protein n=1 Tax=Oleiphilus messinensis TaxID=141451 RepID=A0A1Y0IA50_9GAMM|nr:TIGR04211 family SH3 domain-containing protein [Oleiphilus messinensis]ARU56273.1 SH3 domain protein [Oleiphilus messinensis]